MARDFDGANDRVGDFVVGTTALDTTLSSWSFWTIRDAQVAAGGQQNVASINTSAAQRKQLAHREPTTAGFRLRFVQQTNGNNGIWQTTNDITLNAWHHQGITYDRSALTNDPVLYVDGSSVAVTEVTTPTMTIQTGDDRIRLGEDSSGAFDFDGIIGEFAEWNVILTADEMLALSRGVSPTRIRSDALQAYIPLHGSQSPEVEIRTGTTGTVTGTTQVNHVPKVMPWGWMFDGWRGLQNPAASGWAHLLGDSRNRLIYAGGGD